MSNQRGVIEGTQPQGVDESIPYTITTTNIGSSPSVTQVKVYDVRDSFSDVTSTVMPSGSASVNGDVITLPELTALTEGRLYRVEVACTIAGADVEIYFLVRAER